MKRLVPALVVVLLALGTQYLCAAEPDLRTPGIRALREEYEDSRAAIAAKRRAELRSILERQLTEQRRRERQARIAGNATLRADASQGVRIFEQALDTLEREDTFIFPAKVRQALERMTAFCTRALATEDAARESGYKLLDTQFAGRLQPLLQQQGVTATPEQLTRFWQAVLADDGKEGPADNGTAAETQSGSDTAAVDADDNASAEGAASDDAVLDSRGEASAWVPVTRVGVEVAAIEVMSLPVAGLTERVERSGKGFQSGAPWKVTLTPLRGFTPPAEGAPPAMRIRSVVGTRPVDVLEWPSRRNGWKLEVRIRPPQPGRSRHGCVLEVDAGRLK